MELLQRIQKNILIAVGAAIVAVLAFFVGGEGKNSIISIKGVERAHADAPGGGGGGGGSGGGNEGGQAGENSGGGGGSSGGRNSSGCSAQNDSSSIGG